MEPRQTSPENFASAEKGEQQSITPMEIGAAEFPADARRNEQAEQRMGQHIESAAQRVAQPQQASSLPTPVQPTVADDATAQSAADDNPIVAADEDLIEKEWVDKAKKLIAETKDDPYRREQEVKKLQMDYVKKRYGKAIGAPEDSAWGN